MVCVVTHLSTQSSFFSTEFLIHDSGYIRYKNGEVNINELDKILSGYFVFNKNLFNEDDLYTYFYHPKSNPNLINSINSEFVRCESISKKAIEYFYSNKVINEI